MNEVEWNLKIDQVATQNFKIPKDEHLFWGRIKNISLKGLSNQRYDIV